MKSHLTLGALLIAAWASAGTAAFNGRFGETFEVPAGWQADPSMKGPAEVIGLHPAAVKPRPGDYDDLRSYRKLGLIQVQAIPKASSGPLDRYAASELAELAKRKGVRIERLEVDGKRWPMGSVFTLIGDSEKVWVWKVFAETTEQVFVVTAGRDKKTAEASELVGRTLGAYLLKAQGSAHETGGSAWDAYDTAAVPIGALFQQPRWTVWLLINGLCALLIGAAGPAGLKRAGTIGWSILGWGNATTFLVSLGVWAAASLHRPAELGAIAAFGPIWLMPAACFFAAKKLGAASPQRVLAAASMLAVVMLGASAWLGHAYPGWPPHVTYAPFIGYYVGVAFGLAFGLAYEPKMPR
ncbi:MAG: hypothetical protein AAB320_05380 [Elusimicrobiota bacterium]|mgnify:CR=1 FL=1